MTTNFYKTLLLLLFTFSCFLAVSQSIAAKTDTAKTKVDTAKAAKKASFRIGADFVNNNVFLGRADTTATPMLSPNFKYSLKNGIYFSGTLDYVTNRKTHKLDGGNLAAGYDFDINDDLSGAVSFTKLFYAATSTQVTSDISSTFNGNLDYDIADMITASASLDYNLNKASVSNDFIFGFGLSHDFIAAGVFGDKDVLLISPMATANSGTQNFYTGYIVRKTAKTARRTAAQNALVNSYDAQLSQFKLLDYEFSLPIEYKTGKFIFHITPTYALAENQFQSAAVDKLLGISTQSTFFYFEAGAALKF